MLSPLSAQEEPPVVVLTVQNEIIVRGVLGQIETMLPNVACVTVFGEALTFMTALERTLDEFRSDGFTEYQLVKALRKDGEFVLTQLPPEIFSAQVFRQVVQEYSLIRMRLAEPSPKGTIVEQIAAQAAKLAEHSSELDGEEQAEEEESVFKLSFDDPSLANVRYLHAALKFAKFEDVVHSSLLMFLHYVSVVAEGRFFGIFATNGEGKVCLVLLQTRLEDEIRASVALS